MNDTTRPNSTSSPATPEAAAAPLPAVGTRVVATGGTRAGCHGEVVGHHFSHGHRYIRVRFDGSPRSSLYQPELVEETGTAQGDLFSEGGA